MESLTWSRSSRAETGMGRDFALQRCHFERSEKSTPRFQNGIGRRGWTNRFATPLFDPELMVGAQGWGCLAPFAVYILASLSRRLYIGVTGDLLRRLHEHRTGILPSFTTRYQITRLVHFEQTPNARAAIERETEVKKWSREKKIRLIESTNAGWLDLAEGWFDQPVHFEEAQGPRNLLSGLPEQAE
jgi:putative endonuclease